MPFRLPLFNLLPQRGVTICLCHERQKQKGKHPYRKLLHIALSFRFISSATSAHQHVVSIDPRDGRKEPTTHRTSLRITLENLAHPYAFPCKDNVFPAYLYYNKVFYSSPTPSILLATARHVNGNEYGMQIKSRMFYTTIPIIPRAKMHHITA